MAKQLVNPVERHLEKGVLGVAAVVLVGVVVLYVAASPNQLEIGGEIVSPSNIDQKLAQTADTVRDRVRNARVDQEVPEPLYDAMVQGLDPYKSASLSLTLKPAVPLGPSVPIVDAAEVGAGRVELATVLPVGTPAVTHGRSTFQVEDAVGNVLPVVSNWVTVSAVFDVKAQSDQLRRQYGVRRKKVIFGPPQLERRMRRPDGSWSDEDWQRIDGWASPPVFPPNPPQITLLREGDRVVVSRRDRDMVEEYLDDLDQHLLQRDLLRPLLPVVDNGDAWDFPIITTRREVLMSDDYYTYPNEPPAANPEDRYGGPTEVRRVVEEEKPITKRLDEVEERIKSAEKTLSENEAMHARNEAFDISNDPKASPADRNRAKDLTQLAEDIAADIRRTLLRGRPNIGQVEDEEVKRERRPTEQFWVHDAKRGSVESGEVYQYRIRPTIANLLAGHPDRFRDPADATVYLIAGEWSHPVEVAIPPDMWYFITSKSQQRNEVGVEIYRWFEGIWVRGPRTQVTVGSKIWAQGRTEVPDRFNPGATERPTVTYETDATVVDIDFERAYRERKRGKGREGWKFGDRSTACCVILADSEGRLFERFVATEKDDPRKTVVAAQVWKPPK